MGKIIDIDGLSEFKNKLESSGSASKLTTSRTLTITDGTNSGTATSFDGSANVNINLPDTIEAGIVVPYDKVLSLGDNNSPVNISACDNDGESVTTSPSGVKFTSDYDTVLLKNITNPIDSQDAATKSYTDNLVESAILAVNPTVIGAATAAQGAKADTAVQRLYVSGAEFTDVSTNKYLTVSAKQTTGGTDVTEHPYQTIAANIGELPSSGAAPVDRDTSQMIIQNYTEGLLGAKAIGDYVHNAMTNYGKATELTNARTIKITGDYFYDSKQFNGSADITFNLWRRNTMWLTSASTVSLTGESAHQIMIAGTSSFAVTITLPDFSTMSSTTNHGTGECFTFYKMFPNSTLTIKSYNSTSCIYIGGSTPSAISSFTISGGSCRVIRVFYSGSGSWYVAMESLTSS